MTDTTDMNELDREIVHRMAMPAFMATKAKIKVLR
jgi:hypothetical protein